MTVNRNFESNQSMKVINLITFNQSKKVIESNRSFESNQTYDMFHVNIYLTHMQFYFF